MESLQKKYDKVNNGKYLSNLFRQCEDDKNHIDKLQRDNKKLTAE